LDFEKWSGLKFIKFELEWKKDRDREENTKKKGDGLELTLLSPDLSPLVLSNFHLTIDTVEKPADYLSLSKTLSLLNLIKVFVDQL